MAASSMTSSVYLHVIEDVINKIRDEFVNNGGPGEDVLNELQGMWETKMMHAGVLLGPAERVALPKPPPAGTTAPVHDLNVPYEGTEEYETPTADMLFPPTPLQTPIPTPLPGSLDNSMYNIPTGGSDYPTPANDTGGNSGTSTETKSGRPSPYMQPPSPWMNQRPSLDVNVAYMEGREDADRGTSHQPLSVTQDFLMMSSGKRKREDFVPQYQNGGYIPQQDGAGDVVVEVSQPNERTSLSTVEMGNMKGRANLGRPLSKIPQLDGQSSDPYDEMLSTPNIYNYQGVVNEDYNIASTPAPNDLQAGTPAVGVHNDVGDDDDDDDEPSLNEDDDDVDDLDDVDEGEDLNTQHLVLAQFDKVTRTKSKWKCTLKDGVMHINDKDILFNKATGEFDF